MATVKKAYKEVVDFLAANKGATVADILDQVIEMCAAKVGTGGGKASTFHRDDEGNVVAIQCYYHKRWFRIDETEFGKKASSASGFNSMSKDGQSKWNKQQAEAKKAEAGLLDQVMAGDLDPADIPAAKEEIAANAKRIEPLYLEDGETLAGYETLEEALQA